MLGKLMLLFIFVPMVELALLIEVGRFLGTVNTIILVIVTGILGAALAKFEGLRVMTDLQKDLMQMKMPADKLIEGVMVLVGGLLLLTPGILTDITGVLLILPISRGMFKEILKKKFAKKVNERTHVKVIDLS